MFQRTSSSSSSLFFNLSWRKSRTKSILFSSCRWVRMEVPDFEDERLLKRLEKAKNFKDIYPKLKLPFKLRRTPDESKKFIQQRLQQYPDGFESISFESYAEIWNHEPDFERREKIKNDIQMILMYYNNVLRTSLFSPATIPLNDMRKMLFKYDSHGARLRYIHFLFIREFDIWFRAQAEEKASQLRQQAEIEDYFEHIGCFDDSTGKLQYGYWRNTLFTRYFRRARHCQTLHKLRQAQMFGQPIIIDCSLEHMMSDYEILSCFRQISSIYHQNRYSLHPFKLCFTGYDKHQNRSYEYLQKNMSEYLEKPELFFNLHSQSYQELFPEDRLIYLSPDARKIMTDFDPTAIYIIGALVSKTYKASLTLEKANRENLECLRLPIHQFVQLKPMVKRVLSFRGVFQILLELKHGADWHTALRNSIQPHKLVDRLP